ncbi:MAG: hypothetical protein CL677_00830 [Bdellovibrionaceae bacterium]|nr:hypothetical protein [Pseudobdellovibrionaceae bacterium]|tara:strand:- start:32020 stop:32997 length:978 start_codon:yes stop_codon:yes gene_type:complete
MGHKSAWLASAIFTLIASGLLLFQNWSDGFEGVSKDLLSKSCKIPESPDQYLLDSCFSQAGKQLIPYIPKYSLWTDDAFKIRNMYLPPGEYVDTSDPNNWRFPAGTIFYKNFSRDNLTVETRQMEKINDSEWRFSTYLWNAEQNRAELVTNDVFNALGTGHTIPATSKCTGCHNPNVGEEPVLGFNRLQLSQFEGVDRLLNRLYTQKLFTHEVDDLEIVGSEAAQKALGYLHVNCGTCHRDNGQCADQTDYRFNYSFSTPNIENTNVIQTAGTDLQKSTNCSDIDNASAVYCNVETGNMPSSILSGIELVDPEALKLLRDWMTEL